MHSITTVHVVYVPAIIIKMVALADLYILSKVLDACSVMSELLSSAVVERFKRS
jgi:hypothetical protein